LVFLLLGLPPPPPPSFIFLSPLVFCVLLGVSYVLLLCLLNKYAPPLFYCLLCFAFFAPFLFALLILVCLCCFSGFAPLIIYYIYYQASFRLILFIPFIIIYIYLPPLSPPLFLICPLPLPPALFTPLINGACFAYIIVFAPPPFIYIFIYS